MGFLSRAAVFLLLASLAVGAQAQGWRAGVGRVAITPREPVWMAGFGNRDHPFEGVRTELWAKALALEDEAGKRSVLVTLDLCDISREIADEIARRCLDKYGLTRDRLALNVSHTHSGPVVTLASISGWYDMTPEQEESVRRYTRGMVERVVEAVGQANANLAPAALAFQNGLAGIAVNRRRVQLRHLPGRVDQDVPVLSVRGSDGGLKAAVVGYSCHATALNDYQISGDWPGFAMLELERAHPGTTAMFLQGCGADANALPRRTVELAQSNGNILAAAAEEVLRGKMKPLAGPLRTAFELVNVPFAAPPSREELRSGREKGSRPMRRQYQRLLDVLDRDGKLPDHYPYPVQVWRFNGLKMIVLGGEVVADYCLRLKAQHGWEDTWVAGFSNDVFAYIPSLRVLREGGYEGGGAMIGDGHPGPFAEPVEEIIVAKTAELVERTSK
jgi:neutral ceramidase